LTVLIVEDEQSASRLLSAIAQEVGLSARTTGSAKEAQALCAQAAHSGAPFSAVVLDLVLSELDGFQFATAARAAPWGEKLPIVVVSGVYKTLPPEFAGKVKPAAFFAKPFEPAALRQALARLTGAQPATPSMEGELSDKPASALFVELLKNKWTGVLTVTVDQARRAITFQQGMVRFAQSNLRQETVGASQVASGAIKQTSVDRAVALAKQQGIALHEALASARVMTPEQLRSALKQQTSDVCIAALALSAGNYRFEQKPPEAVSGLPDLRASPVALVLDAAKRIGQFGPARRWLEQHAAEHLNRSPELEREMFAVKTYWPGESVSPLATGGRTVGEVLARIKEPEFPLLQFLCQSGLLALSGGAGKPSAGKQQAAASAGPADEDKGKVFTAQEHATRKMLFGERDHLQEASHYQVLGVAPGASVEEIKKAYFAAAKKFHSDSFSGMELGSARRAAEELFAKVNEASTVLSDTDQRAEYDVFLDRKAKGLPTDVGAILRAEGIFQKGELFFKNGRWEDAEAQFREAISLNDSEAEFHAYLGMAIFKRTGKADDGLTHVHKALEMEPRLRSGTVFAAQIFEAQGELERAKTVLRKAIDKDPEFSQAKDELKRLRNRPAEQTKGGFFSRLLKK
jgi:curved DNA-binding protein CbpA/CheY-like chemotaxis protein